MNKLVWIGVAVVAAVLLFMVWNIETLPDPRVWIRWAERRVVVFEDATAAKLLNQLSNLTFEVMRTLPHIKYRHRDVK